MINHVPSLICPLGQPVSFKPEYVRVRFTDIHTRLVNSWLFGLCAVVIIASLVLGGGTRPGFLSDVILQLISLPLLLVVCWQSLDQFPTRHMRWAYAFCFALLCVPLAQLIPLPPTLWTLLANREPISLSYDLIGHDLPWRPLSVSPQATWLSLISLIPPLSIFLAVLLLGYRQRTHLSLIIVAIGLISVFLGLTQVAQGSESLLRFFDFTNLTEAVGFFANRNHYSALLYSIMLFAAVWLIEEMRRSDHKPDDNKYDTAKILLLLAGFTVIVAFIGAQTIARSRAGLGLTIVALIGIIALSISGRHHPQKTVRQSLFKITSTKLIGAATLVAVIFATQFALFRIMERFAKDPLKDARIPFTRNTLDAAEAFIPFGSGMGSFVHVYGMFEKPEDTLAGSYANRAHNDIAELWLETGIMGALLMTLFMIWLIWRAIKIWRSPNPNAPKVNQGLAKAAIIVIGLLIAHSLVDYPLRTSAIMSVLAFSCAILIDPMRLHASTEDIADLKQSQINLRSNPVAAAPALPYASQPVDIEWPIEPQNSPPTSVNPAPAAWPKPNQGPQAPASSTVSAADTPWLDEMEWPDEWQKPQKKTNPSKE